MKKNVPLLICVQSKNNLPFLSTAHWGRLVKECVSERERESKCSRGPNKKKREKGREGGIEMENGAQVGGQRQGIRGKKKAKKEECWERCGTDESSRVRMSS